MNCRPVVWQRFREFTADLEGKEVPFLYLDSADPRGFVTIGEGNLCPLGMAIGLPFTWSDGRRATRREITAAWLRVDGRQDLRKQGGMVYGGLEGNEIRISKEAIGELVRSKFLDTDRTLAGMFDAWADWPACAQLALFSWAWAVGPAARYPRMIAALHERDFMTASEQCIVNPRRGTIETRNQRNVMLLRNADRVQAYKLDPEFLNWEDLVGVGDVPTQPELPVYDLSKESDFPPPPEGSYAGALEALESARTNAASAPTTYPTPDTLAGICVDEPPDDAA